MLKISSKELFDFESNSRSIDSAPSAGACRDFEEMAAPKVMIASSPEKGSAFWVTSLVALSGSSEK